MGLGAPEIILILLVIVVFIPFWIIPIVWGYKAGAKRNIGSSMGLLLGLLLSYIGVVIVYCSPIIEQPDFNNFPFNSAADELKKYKQLLDSGAITEQEFNLQKARILR